MARTQAVVQGAYHITLTEGPSAGEIWDAAKYADSRHCFRVTFKGHFLEASHAHLNIRRVQLSVRVVGAKYANKSNPDESLLVEVDDIEYGEGFAPSNIPQHSSATIAFDTKRRRGGLNPS